MKLLNEIAEWLLQSLRAKREDGWVKWIAQWNDWQDDCDKFNGCYFNVKQMPQHPQHYHCQCRLEEIPKPIPNVTARATCDIRKFTGYVFNEEKNKGKKKLFEGWGYTIEDSAYLQQLYIEQALQKYCDGQYALKGTNGYAVSIEIVIDIQTPYKGIIHIKTGWVLLPNGEIKLSTPFSGFGN